MDVVVVSDSAAVVEVRVEGVELVKALEQEPRPRVRNTSATRTCPDCGAMARVTSAPRAWPEHVTNRLRYYKCQSGHNFKA